MSRLEWFKERVGKRVFRNGNMCTCAVCTDVYKFGLIISDDLHAIYLSDTELAYNLDNTPLKYFDTVKERDEFEKTLE